MLSPIIAALDRVELLTYAYEIEHLCALNYLGRVQPDAASTMVRMLTDLKLYNIMQGREVNFRFSDLSSAFSDRLWKYIKRLFLKGDESIPDKAAKERPILHLTTHNLLGISEPVFEGLGQRVVMIEVVRHPLYRIKQQALNMERLISDVRHFSIHYEYRGQELPYWALGWEDLFFRSSPVEKAIYKMDCLDRLIEKTTETLSQKNNALITIPFEIFVIDPWPYLSQIELALGSKVTLYTRKVMKKQKVPRKMYAEGISLRIYKRCGWEPPKYSNEEDELAARRKYMAERTSKDALQLLDTLCERYEERFMGGRKHYKQ
jgi:hypothetical protein